MSSQSPDPITPPEHWVCVGRVLEAHGLTGELKVQSFTENPKHIGAYGPLLLVECDEVLTVLKVRGQKKDHVIIRAKEVCDRDTAELLKGQRLYIDKDKRPAIQEDDAFYMSDLEGLALRDKNDQLIGSVIRVHNYGAGDNLEIQLSDHKESVMVPFLKEWILAIDLEKKVVVIDQVYLREYLKPFKPSDERWDETK